jgi:hypothetical protein
MITKISYRGLLLCLLAIIPCTGAFSQDNVYKIWPPSVEASALARYAAYPVNTYTGTPNITIPLYEIKVRDITVPISLSYHASGIRVRDEATWVGLGWVLNAGGMITRSIRGQDDISSRYFRNNFLIPEELQGACIHYTCNGFFDPSYRTLWLNYFNNYKDYDFEPDLFYFNFLNYTGKFSFKQDGTAIILGEDQNMRISFLDNDRKWDGFRIVTPDGTQYNFYGNENYAYGSSFIGGVDGSNSTSNYCHRWNLSSIVSTKGDTIKLFYNHMQGSVERSFSMKKYYNATFTRGSVFSYLDCDICTRKNTGGLVDSRSVTKYYDFLLSRIEFASGVINIHASKTRLDRLEDKMDPLYKIDSISITDNSENPLKITRFFYSYFQSKNGQTKKLRLDSIAESNQGTYAFVYNNEIPCPDRETMSVDHWGYYNAAPNTTWFPTVKTVSMYNPNVPITLNPNGANRECNPAAIQTCMLKGVIYPTGGYTKFEYEPHGYFDTEKKINKIGGGLRIKKMIISSGKANEPVQETSYRYYSQSSACGVTRSYGKILCPVYYLYSHGAKYIIPDVGEPPTVGFDFYCDRQELYQNSFTQFSGNAVGYDTIFVYHGTNGKTALPGILLLIT